MNKTKNIHNLAIVMFYCHDCHDCLWTNLMKTTLNWSTFSRESQSKPPESHENPRESLTYDYRDTYLYLQYCACMYIASSYCGDMSFGMELGYPFARSSDVLYPSLYKFHINHRKQMFIYKCFASKQLMYFLVGGHVCMHVNYN